jgi:sec-independent protein translocase protein TatA
MGFDNPLHIAFLVVILLLVFGARRLPEIGRSIGEGMRSFKEGITASGDSKSTLTPPAPAAHDPAPQPPPPPASVAPPTGTEQSASQPR